jgi:hypothetical protein
MKPHPRIRRSIKWGGLALCLLLAGVWVRSECVWETFLGSYWQVWSWRGACGIHRHDFNYLVAGYLRIPDGSAPARYTMPVIDWTSSLQGAIIPFWVLLLPTLLATAAAWRLDARARRRARAGLCATCHYDRAGLATSAVCPECGAPSAPAA